MGDSYREELKKNQKRIRASDSASANRAKAATRAAIRKLNARKPPPGYHQAHTRQMRLW